MNGVDISHYQRGLTIRQIREAGKAFAVIKLTEGDRLVDSAAFGFYREAYGLGFPVGCYCYSHALSEEEAAAEAAFLLDTLPRGLRLGRDALGTAPSGRAAGGLPCVGRKVGRRAAVVSLRPLADGRQRAHRGLRRMRGHGRGRLRAL